MRDIHKDGRVVVVDRTRTGASQASDPVAHGKEALYDAIDREDGTVEEIPYWTETDRSAYVVVGMTENRAVERQLTDLGVERSRPEGVIYHPTKIDGDTALVVAGTDDRGLMYALFELAERIDDAGIEALSAVEGMVEFPDNEIRGVDRFITGPIVDGWFYDDEFWKYYLDRLARCRFNRLTLITGYHTEFMAPPYPYFVDVPGYQDARITDEPAPTREEHLDQLRTIGRLCHEYGLEFAFGSWQQRQDTDLVAGLPDDPKAFASYCTGGMHELLLACPEIDGVHLRINYEAGIGEYGDTAEGFWHEMIRTIEEASDDREGELFLDLRAKGLTDDMIQWGLETGLDVSVPTKYSWEATGLPYHTSQMREDELENLDNLDKSRRYSYADLLREPRGYDMLYRLWVIGTNRVLLWGDPDYARRFSHSAGFGDGRGYQVTVPLSTKHRVFEEDESWPLFDDPDLRDYEWEDERYWAWYRLFGRLGYSTDADPDAWEREFRKRFGDAGTALLRGYRSASKVLPLLTSWHLTRHPAGANWGEMDTGGALFAEHNYNPSHGDVTYLTAEPGDPGLFYGIDEYAADALEGEIAGKYTPVQVADWFEELATETREAVDAAESDVGSEHEGGEFETTILDLRILADLAEFHARKARAAVELGCYRVTGDASFLKPARESMAAAIEAWESLADRSEAYHDDLVFRNDRGSRGHWRDRLSELEADLKELDRQLDEVDVDGGASHVGAVRSRSRPGPSFDAAVPDTCPPGEDLEIHVDTGEFDRPNGFRLHYRRADLTEGAFTAVEMDETDRGFRGTVPGEYLMPTFDLLVYFTTVGDNGDVVIVPGLYHAEHPAPYHVITVERE